MRISRRIVPLLLVTTVSITGCSAAPVLPTPGPTSVPVVSSSTPATQSGPTKPVSSPALTAALLAASELSGSYTEMAIANSPAGQMGSSMRDCADAGSPSKGEATVQRVFQGGMTGPFMAETLTSMTSAEAEDLMTRLRTVVQNCNQFGGSMPGGIKLTITLDPLTFPRVGDDTVALRLTGSVPSAGAAIYAHLVSVRLGGVVAIVVLMQLTSPEVSATEGIVRAAVTKAEKKLA